MVAITKEQIMTFWENNSDDMDEIIEECGFDVNEVKQENLEKLSQDELNNLMQYLVYLVINGPGGGDYESMYYYLCEEEDGVFDSETTGFLLST